MYEGKKIGMIIPAAGIGSRMGSSTKKQFLSIGGKAILRRTLEHLVEDSICDEVVLVVGLEEVDSLLDVVKNQWQITKDLKIISGGSNRQESVKKGLNALQTVDFVFVHDGVRPFAKKEWLPKMMACMEATFGIKGLSVGKPVSDTLKEITTGEIVLKTLKRDILWSVQTPQLFLYMDLLEAHLNAEKTNYCGTDDASLIEREGGKVKLLYFGDENIKITTPFDLIVAEAILNRKSDL
ncbi:2-C-methyl-D-erythritol 4-phosphate cytidylyltransferase [Fusibacter sp. 3D3]|uniref:2-C-methyl-D-erythritol 4-phosphate cytidylyltransferase n=1 Tax=Fusibacter sp. 3D3 TaxID=1048380 RepID=UPI0008537452|nr:2-C-methyl-D-erythritol 4-phosphate cytidylyltransferase [Fusibacter sp. 3D3]GAU79720.1 2-C-methyl-D-erythritol 4-phosphate cytidylyltransferase [Fusibacter sp. 3D3]